MIKYRSMMRFYILMLLTVVAFSGGFSAMFLQVTADEKDSIRILAHPDGTPAPAEGSLPFPEALKQLQAMCETHPDRSKILELAGGVYYLSDTIALDEAFSGTEQGPVIIRAVQGQEPVLSGTLPVTGWEPYDSDRWAVHLPDLEVVPNQFFVDHEIRPRGRAPDKGYFYSTGPYNIEERKTRRPPGQNPSQRKFYVDPEQIPFEEDPWLIALHSWTVSLHRIAEMDPESGLLTMASESQHPFNKWNFRMPFWLEGYVGTVTQPGEWAFDEQEKILVYYPYPHEQMENLAAEVGVLDTLLSLRGDPENDRWLGHISLQGLRFRGGNWTLARDNSADGQNHRHFHSSGVYLHGVSDAEITDCSFTGMGNYALWVDHACRRVRITGNDFRHNASGAIRVGGDAMPPVEEWLCREITIENNLVEHNALVFRGATAIWLSQAIHSRVAHNEVAYQPYTGISVGWGWGADETGTEGSYANEICYNYLHHLGDGLKSDLAGIYTLTKSPGTEVYGNVIHDIKTRIYIGVGLYADAATADILFRDNLIFNTSSAGIFRNFGRRLSFMNNIVAETLSEPGLISNGRGLRAPRDEVWMRAENNVFYSTIGRDMIAPGRFDQGPFEFDRNLYWSTVGDPVFGFVAPEQETSAGRIPTAWDPELSLEAWQQAGFDEQSLALDPYGPEGPDPSFRLPDDSPARAIGAGSDEFLKAGLSERPFSKFRRDEPYIPSWPIPQIPPAIIQDNFERSAGAILPAGIYLENASVDDFSIRENAAKEGRVLHWRVRPGQRQMRCETEIPAEALATRFDFNLGEGAELNIVLRDGNHGQMTELFRLSILSDRQAFINGAAAGAVGEDSSWYTFELHRHETLTDTWRVRVLDASGSAAIDTEVPFHTQADTRIHWSLVAAARGVPAEVMLDQLCIQWAGK